MSSEWPEGLPALSILPGYLLARRVVAHEANAVFEVFYAPGRLYLRGMRVLCYGYPRWLFREGEIVADWAILRESDICATVNTA